MHNSIDKIRQLFLFHRFTILFVDKLIGSKIVEYFVRSRELSEKNEKLLKSKLRFYEQEWDKQIYLVTNHKFKHIVLLNTSSIKEVMIER